MRGGVNIIVSMIQRFLLFVATLACASPIAAGATASGPSQSALQRLDDLRPSRLGIDRRGYLWSWNQSTGATAFLSPEGDLRPGPTVKDASSVDLDSEWGVVELRGAGARLVIHPVDGRAQRVVTLPNRAVEVCWVGADTVAVSPALSGHRVEIWDLAKGLLAFAIGDEAPIVPRVGAVMERTVLLHFDHPRQRLATLDALSGDYQVFDLAGHLLFRSKAPVPEREVASLKSWLEAVDATARAAGDSQTPGVFYFNDFALDSKGQAWVVGERDRSEGRTTFLVIRDGGKVDRHVLETSDCSAPGVTVWGPWLIQYTDAAAPSGFCIGKRRLP